MPIEFGTDDDDNFLIGEDLAIIDGRGGNDRFEIRFSAGHLLTGGRGRDVYALEFGDSPAVSVVTDFTAGVAGDAIDLTAQLGFLAQYGYEAGNPFARGIFRWEQQGSNAVLAYDEAWFEPRASRGEFTQVLILENTSVLQLSTENMGGFEPVPLFGYGNKVRGSAENDVLVGTDAADGMIGFLGDDRIIGEGGDDFISAGGGNDEISGGAGNDRLEGGAGDDFIFDDGESADALIGGAGNDFLNVIGGSGSIIEGGTGNDEILVQDADLVRVFGGSGDDLITIEGLYVSHVEGGSGKDTIFGGVNDDVIVGGAGADLLGGDTGADTYVYQAIADSLAGRGADRIIGFEAGVDIIDLSAIDALGDTPEIDAFAFVGTAAFTGVGQLRFDTSVAGQVTLSANVFGDLRADFQIIVTGDAPLVSDILI